MKSINLNPIMSIICSTTKMIKKEMKKRMMSSNSLTKMEKSTIWTQINSTNRMMEQISSDSIMHLISYRAQLVKWMEWWTVLLLLQLLKLDRFIPSRMYKRRLRQVMIPINLHKIRTYSISNSYTSIKTSAKSKQVHTRRSLIMELIQATQHPLLRILHHPHCTRTHLQTITSMDHTNSSSSLRLRTITIRSQIKRQTTTIVFIENGEAFCK